MNELTKSIQEDVLVYEPREGIIQTFEKWRNTLGSRGFRILQLKPNTWTVGLACIGSRASQT